MQKTFFGWLVVLLAVLCGTVVADEVSTDQPGSLLVFPKVVVDQTQDTIIQISNATGSRLFARCFYINGAIDPQTQLPSWAVTDFQIKLTRLQPSVWVASQGLPITPPDRPAALYPGPVPPLGAVFTGELRCLIVNESETPISRNALTGEATIIDRVTHSTRKYHGIAVRGLPGNNGDNTLLMNGVEYATCPRVLLLNHFFDEAPDPILTTPVETSLTFVPCSGDIEHAMPGQANLLFEVFNEFEQRLSASFNVQCWADTKLSEIDNQSTPTRSIFHYAMQGTLVGQTRIRPAPDADTSTGHGVLAIAEEFRDNRTVGAGINVHFIGGNLQGDVFAVPGSF